MYKKDLTYICGVKNVKNLINKPFNNQTINFLSELSRLIVQDKKNRIYPDLISFAFWIRNSRIINVKKKISNLNFKVSKGTVFHISTSNVPCIFRSPATLVIFSNLYNLSTTYKSSIFSHRVASKKQTS